MKQALYILAVLSDRDFNWLIAAGKRCRVPAGTVLIQQGEPLGALYIILDGTLVVSTETLGDSEIARLSSGEVVGEISFVDFRPPTATVKAAEDSLVWSISRSELATKLLQEADFASHFYHALALFLADRLRGTVSLLTYSPEPHTLEADTSPHDLHPEFLGSLETAHSRLDRLINSMKDVISF
ncbi:MAG TPA: cyclic nucleotide-binding protein [Cyanobacteria bacterium UBA8803]|nr:cyclic nucleotide-binding protein [Cyanobacteria bacterium UBA9273]HBL62623.1 cyclic nucleotide-binding protein [Cyanobacteria bacterium UBA8803]